MATCTDVKRRITCSVLSIGFCVSHLPPELFPLIKCYNRLVNESLLSLEKWILFSLPLLFVFSLTVKRCSPEMLKARYSTIKVQFD